uniref:DUF834 domain-containing protein n=1 Tax=Oryza glumipatula TaxID=40148 RepID=A0A0E0A4A0_9ORYZ
MSVQKCTSTAHAYHMLVTAAPMVLAARVAPDSEGDGGPHGISGCGRDSGRGRGDGGHGRDNAESREGGREGDGGEGGTQYMSALPKDAKNSQSSKLT